MLEYQEKFIHYALELGVLRFGEFQLKSGRNSPYFFNTGLFNTGASLDRLGQFYAQTLIQANAEIDVLYGPAYKGIPLASSTAIAYSRSHTDLPFAFNRKEIKDHGEGGLIVGSPLQGKVWIIDDVITAGTSVRESVEIIKASGATVAGVVIALDRQEKGINGLSAVQEVTSQLSIPVLSIISLGQIIQYIELHEPESEKLMVIKKYRAEYGIE